MKLSILILTLGLVSDVVSGSTLRARRHHASLASRRAIQPIEVDSPSNESTTPPVEFKAQEIPTISKRKPTKRCKAPSRPQSAAPKEASSSAAPAPKGTPKPATNVEEKPKPKPASSSNSNSGSSNSGSSNNTPAPLTGGSKLNQIKNLHAFAGFVYAVSPCQSKSKAQSDFERMKSMGARVVITFDVCQGQDQATFYGNLISAAGAADMSIIPLIPTLSTNIQTEINGVVAAVKANHGPVLAIAVGDEPLYDNDFGSPGNLASKINSIKGSLSGLGIPVSISDMAFGWQQAGTPQSVVDAVDFFMVNNFPYFAGNAGNGDNAWNSFKSDISFFQKIANGRPILVTQTGWPSDKREFPSNTATASVGNEQKYFNLLDSHCGDFFKPNNIGWMWRGFDDNIAGWGVLNADGSQKFAVHPKTSC